MSCQAAPGPRGTAPSPDTPANLTPTSPKEPAAPESDKKARAVEVVRVPWEGAVIEKDEFCPHARTTSFPVSLPYRKIEIQEAGIGIRETAFYSEDSREPVTLEIGGCTHETATFDFIIDRVYAEESEQELIQEGLDLLQNTLLVGRGPIYQEEIIEAFEKGTREPPNMISHNAMIIYDVEALGKKTRVQFHYDFAL